MGRLIRTLCMAAACVGTLCAGASGAWAITVAELAALADQGKDSAAMMAAISQDLDVPQLSDGDIENLRSHGVPDEVISALQARNVSQTDNYGGIPMVAPVESSNLPVVLRKFFQDTYETYIIESEVARRYAQLKDETASERASDAELPKVELWRQRIDDNPLGALEACLAMAENFKPDAKSALHAALSQCIGLALDKLDAPAMSAAYLDEALQSDYKAPEYAKTLAVFLKNAHQTEYSSSAPLRIYEHTDEVDSAQRQSFMYFIAYNLVYGPETDPARALEILSKMETGDIYYARALLLAATLLVRAPDFKFKTAADLLQTALTELDKINDSATFELTNMAWLALARIAFENHAYDMADAFYRKVDINSHHLRDVIVEDAWGRLFSGHHAEALAMTHALEAPYFDKVWAPDKQVIEAAAYLGLCRYDQAAGTLSVFRENALSDAARLKAYLAQTPARDFYGQIVSHAQNPDTSALPGRIYYRVLADHEFNRVHRRIRKLGEERRQMGQYVGAGFTHWPGLQAKYDEEIAQRQQLMATILSRVYDKALSELHALDITASQIAIEIKLAQRRREAECLRIVAAGGQCETEIIESSEASFTKRDNEVFWNFNGEFWRDEILHYVSGVTSMCPDKN